MKALFALPVLLGAMIGGLVGTWGVVSTPIHALGYLKNGTWQSAFEVYGAPWGIAEWAGVVSILNAWPAGIFELIWGGGLFVSCIVLAEIDWG